jgi:hypothetical protein
VQAYAPLGSLEQNRSAIGTALPSVKLRDHRSNRKYLEKEDCLLWCVRSSEGLAFGLKPA